MNAVEEIIVHAEWWATIVEKSGNESEHVGASNIRALAALAKVPR